MQDSKLLSFPFRNMFYSWCCQLSRNQRTTYKKKTKVVKMPGKKIKSPKVHHWKMKKLEASPEHLTNTSTQI